MLASWRGAAAEKGAEPICHSNRRRVDSLLKLIRDQVA